MNGKGLLIGCGCLAALAGVLLLAGREPAQAGGAFGASRVRTEYIAAKMDYTCRNVTEETAADTTMDASQRRYYTIDAAAFAKQIEDKAQKLSDDGFRIIAVVPVTQGQSRAIERSGESSTGIMAGGVGVGMGAFGAGVSFTQGVLLVASK